MYYCSDLFVRLITQLTRRLDAKLLGQAPRFLDKTRQRQDKNIFYNRIMEISNGIFVVPICVCTINYF